MNYYFLIILAFLNLDCAQSPKNSDECRYGKYFANISKALSEKYAKEDWEQVNEIFKSTINQVDFSYGKDLEEALEVALKVKDKTFAKQIIIKLLEGGIPIAYFNNYDEIKTERYCEEIVNNHVENHSSKKKI